MIDWYGLYREGWGQDIVPEAYSHPAKFAPGLIRQIYAHAIEQDYLKPGDVVIDPFGGVALGALDAMRRGLMWVGVELEQRFVELGNQNIDLWMKRYGYHFPGWGRAALIQGDSRRLVEVLGEAAACVSSPPYSGLGINSGEGPNSSGERHNRISPTEQAAKAIGVGYGSASGNLGNLPATAAGYDAALSSPPFRSGGHHDGVFDTWGGEISRGKGGCADWAKKEINYGDAHGQLEQMGDADDFWLAARQIVDQVYQVLKPRGVAIWVTKSFVKDKKRVDFPVQWRHMCEAAGFETAEEIRAWLVEDRGAQYDLEGELHERKVERKSFFRRLAEKNGAPPIDWEMVTIMRKEAK